MEEIAKEFNQHLTDLIDLLVAIYPDDKIICSLQMKVSMMVDHLPYKAIDSARPHIVKYAKQIVARDATLFVEGKLKLTDDKEVIELTKLLQKYWGTMTDAIHGVIFDHIHNMLSLCAK
jgi:hypothetical protein